MAYWVRNDFVWEDKRTHQEGTQKSDSHHQTRSRSDLKGCSVTLGRNDIVVVAVIIVIIIVIIIIIIIIVIVIVIVIIV